MKEVTISLVSVEGNFSQLTFFSPLNSMLIINFENVWCRFLLNKSMFGFVQYECRSECTVKLMNRSGMEQCACKNNARQPDTTLLNERRSTMLHVSIHNELSSGNSYRTFKAHPIYEFYHYSLGRFY